MYVPVTLANAVVLFAFHREMCGPSAMKLCTKLADISWSNIGLNMLCRFFTVSRYLIYLLSVSVTTESLGDWSIGHIAILFKR